MYFSGWFPSLSVVSMSDVTDIIVIDSSLTMAIITVAGLYHAHFHVEET